jgi:hypothetical protein
MNHPRIGTALAALAAVVLAVAGCSMLNSSSPTKTFTAFWEAAKKKDPAAMKKTLSKGSITMLEKQAKEQNKSLDDMLKDTKFDENDAGDKPPELRNEKIDGDNATLEIRRTPKGDDWDKLPFVKEDGEWKIAFDKFMEEMMNKMKEKMPDMH